MQVSIIEGSRKRPNGFFQRPKEGGVKIYLLLGQDPLDLAGALEQQGFTKAPWPARDPAHAERFLQEYIDLIGRIGKEHNTLNWWSTDIASKNRFTSQIPHYLQSFAAAVETIERGDFDHLVLLNPSWVVSGALRKLVRSKGLDGDWIMDGGQRTKDILIGGFQRIWKTLSAAVLVTVRKCYAQTVLRDRLRKLRVESRSRPSYIIKTFFYEHSVSDSGVYRDAFFGPLPEFIKGRRPTVIYAVVAGGYRKSLRMMKRCLDHNVLPMEAFLSFSEVFRTLFGVLFCKIYLRQEALFFGHDVSGIINNELLRTRNGISFYQRLHYGATKRLLKAVPADVFLLTYENNPWEKMCTMAIRECAPHTMVFGYQHTVIPQASANMFVSGEESGVMPMPDRIFTVGGAAKAIMEKYGAYHAGKVESSCALRFEYLFRTESFARSRSRHLLVALEGIFDVYKLVNYVIRELKDNPAYQVRFRTHPVLPLSRIEHKLDGRVADVDHFELSRKTSLKQDIEWADAVLYWGSTVSLEALKLGKPVIHYETDSLLSYDPLFECRHLKWSVSERDSLSETLETIHSMEDGPFERENAEANTYLNGYFHPVTPEALSKFVS